MNTKKKWKYTSNEITTRKQGESDQEAGTVQLENRRKYFYKQKDTIQAIEKKKNEAHRATMVAIENSISYRMKEYRKHL